MWIDDSCRRVSELASAAMDRRLTRRERFIMRMHQLMCGACRRYNRQLHLVREALGRILPSADFPSGAELGLSPEARARIHSAILSRQ